MEIIRADKFISVACGVSRNDAKVMIRNNSVAVDGRIIKKADEKIRSDSSILVSGQEFFYKKYIYLIMNKPKGVLSASTDKRVMTVVDLVPERFRHYQLFPVGRLDKDTTGLLLITNDGDFAHRVISPKSKTDKLYLATLDGPVNEAHVDLFRNGIVLSDGTQCMSAVLQPLDDNKAFVTIQEGKYHQVKRMFGTVGLGVNELKRLSIGSLELPFDLNEGDCRELTNEELGKLL